MTSPALVGQEMTLRVKDSLCLFVKAGDEDRWVQNFEFLNNVIK